MVAAFVVSTTDSLSRRRVFGWVVGLAAAALFGALAVLVDPGGELAFDTAVQTWFLEQRSESVTAVAHTLDVLGIYWLLGAAALVVAAVLWSDHRRSAIFLTIGFWGAIALNLALKSLFARPRPSAFDPLLEAPNYSFPSGHAMGSWAFALCGALLLARLAPPRRAWSGIALLALFALLVGASRVYLQVHFPSDVLAGWSASTVWVLLLTVWYRRANA